MSLPLTRPTRQKQQLFIWQRVGLLAIIFLTGIGSIFILQPTNAQVLSTIRINAGGPTLSVNGVTWDRCAAITLCQGRVNNGYANGPNPAPVVSNVTAPASQEIYQREWTGGQNGVAFTFNITVTNGSYLVRLHFAELTKTGVGQRTFGVNLEGTPILDNFDIWAAAGQNTAVVREFPVSITDTTVTLQFLRQTDNPLISGIEILPNEVAPTATAPATATITSVVPTITATATPVPGTTALFSWQAAADVPLARFEAQGAAVNGKLYVIGGFYNSQTQSSANVDVYDPGTNTWQRIADIPEAVTHAPVVVDGSTLYVLGGYLGDNPGASSERIWKLNTLTNVWSAGPNLPAARGGAAAALVGRNLHFFGGATRSDGQFDDTDQAEHFVLNLDSGLWTTAAPLPNPRNHLAGVSLNGKIYAIGGQHNRLEESTNQSQVDVYDPGTNTWSRAADLPTAKGHTSASTFVVDGRIMMIGGSINGGTNGIASDEVVLYDPVSDVWLKLPSIPAIRKTPVADIIGNLIVVATGGGYGATNTTWIGSLPNTWETGATMPNALGEVAGGIINNRLYLVGESSSATIAYNLSTNTYSSTNALTQRPFKGNHHTAEVINDQLYLFGGLGANKTAAGKVQIYDPAANSWSLGADMPFTAGASASALIDGQVYVAGGIDPFSTGPFSTTNRVARYNPTTNTWTELAPMPQGRNHAAAATDGSKLYVFGGRGPGSGDTNTVENGFATVQIYDPATNTWQSSLDPGSTLAPVPQGRGGMGRAVYHQGEFYVMGGETNTGAGATTTNVYSRVDIYTPSTNTWRLGTPMPTARHGIFPLLIAGRIYVGGGGVKAGFSSSALMEIYNPGPAPIVDSGTPTATATATVTQPTAPAITVTPLVGSETPTATATITQPTAPTITVTPTIATPGGSQQLYLPLILK